LCRAAATGHFHDPPNVAHLDKDPDLDCLRQWDDYRHFRAGLKPPGP
jgi:hypothetical protein